MQRDTPSCETGDRLPVSPSPLISTQCDVPGTQGHVPVDPISPTVRLPDELLSFIFSQVQAEVCPTGPSFGSNVEWLRLMFCPVILSRVCSRWYRIATFSPMLWCRIYIHPELFKSSRYVALLEAYRARCSRNLSYICILDSPYNGYSQTSGGWHTNDAFLTFLGSVAPFAKYLVVKSQRGLFSEGHPRSTIAACLNGCMPRILKELTVDIATYDYPVSQTPDMSLDLPRNKLEELWQFTPILRLNGYYPFAINTSNLSASHGLIELRLKGWHPITESTLIGVLVASPQLRILEVSIDIIGSLSKGPSIEPILLENLEVVKSAVANRPLTHQRQLRILLRLLQPGSKPLSLSIFNPNQGTDTAFVCQPEVQAFLGRSNVRQLCVHGLERRSHLVELLKLVPSVRILAVSAIRSLRPDVPVLSNLPTLDSLYVIPSFLSLPYGSIPSPSSDWPTVEWLVETYKFRELIVWPHDFKFGYSNEWDAGGNPIPANLHTICPVVNVMAREEANTAQEWC